MTSDKNGSRFEPVLLDLADDIERQPDANSAARRSIDEAGE